MNCEIYQTDCERDAWLTAFDSGLAVYELKPRFENAAFPYALFVVCSRLPMNWKYAYTLVRDFAKRGILEIPEGEQE